MLEELFLVHRLRPWSRNLGSRHVKTPKLFVADTGLVSALIGVDAQQREVDIVIESPTGDVAGVEVKAAASIGRSDSLGLRFLRDKIGTRFTAGVVLYTGSNTLELDDRIWAVPLAGLWAGPITEPKVSQPLEP
jgi:hypothetical protein